MGRKAKYDIDDLIVKSEGVKIQHDGARCYIYTRVSTTKQVDEGGGLEAQYNRIMEYVEYDHMNVVGVYSDEGVSGKSAEQRENFMQMIDDIQSGKDSIKFVLVFKLSRFGRNASDILFYLQKMQDVGVNLICVEDHIDSSDGTGKLMVSIMGAMAEIERDNILTQSMAGRHKKASDGGWNGGFAPYGYKLVDGKAIIDEEQANIVRIIFDKYAHTSLGADGVARWLNAHGYQKTPPNVVKSKKERKYDFLEEFSREHIVRILDNEFYMGKLAYGKRKNYGVKGQRGVTVTRKQEDYAIYEGQHEGIVDEDLWQICHEKRLATMGKSEKKDKDHEYILSSLIRCPKCGSPMYGAVNRTKKRQDGTPYAPYYYYKCKHQFGQTGHKCEFKTQIGARKIDQSVRDIIMSLVSSQEFSEAIKAKIGQQVNTSDLENEIATLEKRKHQVEGALRKRSQEKDKLDVDDKHYDRKYEEITRAMDSLYDELDEIEATVLERKARIRAIAQEKISQEKIYSLLIHFNEIYDKMSDKEKKELMSLFIDRIEIFEDKQPNGRRIKQIDFKFPIVVDGEEGDSLIFPTLENECRDDMSIVQT